MTEDNKKIVIIGGGFGGLFTALDTAKAGKVSLISSEDHFTFRPMLYEYLSGEVEAWHIAPYYSELFDDEIEFMHGEVCGVDLEQKEIGIDGWRFRVPYDVLVLAVGGVTNYWGIDGAEEFAMPFRNIAHADELRRRMTAAVDSIPSDAAPQDVREALTFAVIGAGASGVELSTKMSDLLFDAIRQRSLKGEPHVLLIEMGNEIVPGMGDEIRSHAQKGLNNARIELHTQTRVVKVKKDGLVAEHNGVQQEFKAAAVVWTAGVKMNPLIEKIELPKDKHGLILAEPTLQVQGHEDIFVLGDIAKVDGIDPKLEGTAQLANQQSKLLGDNIKAYLAGRQLKTKKFHELGEAISLGTQHAAVLVGDKAFSGALAREARFALYTQRLPTWHHRLKVGSSWFFDGTHPRSLRSLS
jgi:NADH:ubiquinone reductase (non-electrogenic)